MQIDRTNFKQQLPSILNKIQQADFIAFDCEFSGLVTKLQQIQGMFPNHIQFYERIKQTAYNFRIIQLGLAAFIFKQNKYIPYVYNFYISPTTFTPGYNNVMICQVQSMQFLAKNNLDFNRVFCKGIKTSKRLYSNDTIKQHQYNQFPMYTADMMFLSPQEEQYVRNIQQNVVAELILPQNLRKMEKIVDFKNKGIFGYFRFKYTNMLFDKGKKNMKQFQYSVRMLPKVQKEQQQKKQNNMKKVQEVTQNTITKQSNTTNNETKVQQKPQQLKPDIKKQQTNTKLPQQLLKTQKSQKKQQQPPPTQQPQPIPSQQQQQIHLSKIFATLITGRKPLIGHFPNLDIGLIYQTFISDLPQTYQQFCYNLNHMFPFIFDTKVLSRRIQSRLKGIRVDLASLFKACFNQKLLKNYANFQMKGLEGYVQKEHQAGYDALITGCSFIGMANYFNNCAGRINYKNIQNQNMLLYSRFSGEVSMSGNRYCSTAQNYDNLIIIHSSTLAQQPKWRQLAQELSKFGSLSVHENHQQIYFVYEEPQNIGEIILKFKDWKLKPYMQRRIIYARNMYRQFQNVMI